jgi:hypothetical protein
MTVSDWIVALFCLGSGAGVVGFWVQRLAARRVDSKQYVMRLHVAAEFVTGAALIAGAIATFADARAPATLVLVGVGLGLLVYASVQSPAFYPDEKQTRISLWVTLVAAVAVFALRLATL